MTPFTDWRSGIIWGYGRYHDNNLSLCAAGPYCFLVNRERWECGPSNMNPDAEHQYLFCYAIRISI